MKFGSWCYGCLRTGLEYKLVRYKTMVCVLDRTNRRNYGVGSLRLESGGLDCYVGREQGYLPGTCAHAGNWIRSTFNTIFAEYKRLLKA